MVTTKRTVGAFGALLGAGASLVLLAGAAGAAPYTASASLAVSASEVDRDDTVTVTGHGYGAGEDVALDLHSSVIRLKTVTADDDGDFSTRVRIPDAAACGSHRIVGTGEETRRDASAQLVVDCGVDDARVPAGGAADEGDEAGGLPKTGAAVGALAAAGVAMIAGGVALRRRRKDG